MRQKTSPLSSLFALGSTFYKFKLWGKIKVFYLSFSLWRWLNETLLRRGQLICCIASLSGLVLLAPAEGTVWIRPPYTSFQEFRAGVIALSPPHISYAESLLREQRERAWAFHLKEKLLVAQELYLSGEEQKALIAFKEITDLSLEADWRAEDRRILIYSFLRRAQSEKDESKKKALLLSVSDFFISKEELEDYPDRDLFPPPLMESLSLIKEKTHLLSVDWAKIFPDHEIILINGKQIQKDIRDIRPRAFYRTHALSSSHFPYLKNVSLSALIEKQIKTKKLTEGYCEKIKIRSNVASLKKLQVLSQANCPKPVLTARLQRDKLREKAKKSSPAEKPEESPLPPVLEGSYAYSGLLSKAADYQSYPPLPTTPSLLDSREFKASMERFEDKGEGGSDLWTKKHSLYIILGVGILAGALIISLDHKKPSSSSSSTQGKYVY